MSRALCLTTLRYATLILIAGCCDRLSAQDAASPVDWKKDGYQVALWKLYHHFEKSRGKSWEDLVKAQTSETLEEVNSYELQYDFVHVGVLKGRALASLDQPHEVRIFVMVDRKTNLVTHVESIIRFEFGGPIQLEALQKRFQGNSVAGRLVRLPGFCEQVAGSLGVASIEIAFRDLRNRNLEWACNGFVIDVNVTTKMGDSRQITYYVGSGLNPFTDRDGNTRDGTFAAKDVLIDPEYGGECELEESGARVFLKR
jgi:hypothetical protein